jgi:hypothetical protein
MKEHRARKSAINKYINVSTIDIYHKISYITNNLLFYIIQFLMIYKTF